MMQRWLATVLLQCEAGFRRVKGHEYIHEVVKNIEKEHGITEGTVKSQLDVAA